MLKTKKFWIAFGISFAATAALTVFLLLVVFRGMFYNIYISKGDARYNKGEYQLAADCYDTARSWKPKNQGAYLKIAQAHMALEDYDNAGSVIDEAIKKKVKTRDSGLEELYLMRIKIYSTAGRLNEAANYISSLDDQYIKKKLELARPSDLVYTPTQGSYDKTLKMTITVREGETVYYTTDGSYPTKFSNIYVDPINITGGTTRITAVAVNAEGLVSPMLTVSYTVTNDYEEVVFDDEKMEKMVRESLSKPVGIIRVKELEGVTELSNDGIDGYLKTLSDLELMPNLTSFHIEGETKLISISQLSGRTSLTSLTLAGCDLDSTEINALGSLTQLQSIDLTDNNLTSISVLSNLPSLKFAFLRKNGIEDISPLSSLQNLLVLDLSENRISDISSLPTSLEALYLTKNTVSDLSGIHTLQKLITLDLSHNLVTDAKNTGKLSALETLSLASNNISNFEFLSELTSLTSLDVSSTSFVSTRAIATLPLISLVANNTGIITVSDIAKIQSLTSLDIAHTDVTDIKALKSLPALDFIDISGCEIEDVSVLGNFPALYTVWAKGLDLDGIEFVNEDVYIVTE